MKKFGLRFSLFALPLILVFLIPVFFLARSGESFHSIDETIASSKKYLIGYAYNSDSYSHIKWKSLKNNQAAYTTVAIGSSRVLQFREEMFKGRFYNGGFTISGIGDFEAFMRSLNNTKNPSYLIIGLDQWMFNASWDDFTQKPDETRWKNSVTDFPDYITFKKVWYDLLNRKYGMETIMKEDRILRIGLNAYTNNMGLRKDGSMCYGIQVSKLLANDPSADDYAYKDTLNRIKKGIAKFQHARFANKEAFQILDNFLAYCQERSIHVVAIFPPFADHAYEKMKDSGNYQYLEEIYPEAKRIFAKYDHEVYDFSSLASCQSSDGEMIDGFHGGELTYLKLLIKVLESGSLLNNVCDLEQLRKDARNPVNKYVVYGY